MTTIYDKVGKTFTIPHQVDVREALRTGNYFLEDPTKRKIIKKKVGKVEERKIEGINEEEPKEKEPVQALFGKLADKVRKK